MADTIATNGIRQLDLIILLLELSMNVHNHPTSPATTRM